MLDERIRNKVWPQVAWWYHSSKYTVGVKTGLGKEDEPGQNSKCDILRIITQSRFKIVVVYCIEPTNKQYKDCVWEKV